MLEIIHSKVMVRLQSQILGINHSSESILNLKSSVCKAFEIMANEIEMIKIL